MDQHTIDTYNKIAEDYDEVISTFWEKHPRTFLDKFIELSGKKIADIGSGTGRDACLLQSGRKEIVCVDASEGMVKLSAAKGFESILAEFTSLPFLDGSFDGVWSYTALLHIPRDSFISALNEIHRILKPSGVFALGLIEGDTEGYRDNMGSDMPRWFSYYQREEVEDACARCGFESLYFESFIPAPKQYRNRGIEDTEHRKAEHATLSMRKYLNFIFRKV